MKLNLNADLGESFGAWTMGDDAALLPALDSASIACGFHAGDPSIIRQTVRAARDRGVTVGAHPAYPDLAGFGRRQMDIAGEALEDLLIYQISALAGIARVERWPLSHVKPHGALSNAACADPKLAICVANAVRACDPDLILLAPACSALAEAGAAAGLRVAIEIFADRRYAPDGQLLPRQQPGAVIHDPAEAIAHVQAMLAQGGLISASGGVLPTPVHSICVHGDSPAAVSMAAALRDALHVAGHTLAPLSEVLDKGTLNAP
ncbi:MAG: 5-oxoprolinase subunit PxpA [Rhodocyclaceae bacterium]|nr:5-oxoprolinase subunit PxpA [Rhodocyclaceae bacterium]